MNPSSSIIRCFTGRNAVITGAASGIGRELAMLLCRSGARVSAIDRNEDGLRSLAAEAAGPGSLSVHSVDVTDLARYEERLAAIDQEAPVDFLFNNAGVTLLGEAHKVPFSQWKWLMDINLMGVVNGVQLVYPRMVARGRGHIINTASIAGVTGYATAAAYTTSKAAVLELTRSLRAEAKGYGVRVSAACPGYVDSAIFQQDRIIGADRDRMIRDLPVKMMTPATAAFKVLQGVARGRKTIIFPFSAWFLWSLACWVPSAIGPFHKRFLRAFREGD